MNRQRARELPSRLVELREFSLGGLLRSRRQIIFRKLAWQHPRAVDVARQTSSDEVPEELHHAPGVAARDALRPVRESLDVGYLAEE